MKAERVVMGVGTRDAHPHSPAVIQPAWPLLALSTPLVHLGFLICLTLMVLRGKSYPTQEVVQGLQCLPAHCGISRVRGK